MVSLHATQGVLAGRQRRLSCSAASGRGVKQEQIEGPRGAAGTKAAACKQPQHGLGDVRHVRRRPGMVRRATCASPGRSMRTRKYERSTVLSCSRQSPSGSAGHRPRRARGRAPRAQQFVEVGDVHVEGGGAQYPAPPPPCADSARACRLARQGPARRRRSRRGSAEPWPAASRRLTSVVLSLSCHEHHCSTRTAFVKNTVRYKRRSTRRSTRRSFRWAVPLTSRRPKAYVCAGCVRCNLRESVRCSVRYARTYASRRGTVSGIVLSQRLPHSTRSTARHCTNPPARRPRPHSGPYINRLHFVSPCGGIPASGG